MSSRIAVGKNPVQITNGTTSAHITIKSGSILYADSADSADWHELQKRELNVNAPVTLFVRAWSGDAAEITVTTWTNKTN